MIRAENLSFSYSQEQVFSDFELTIDGKFCGLIGVNGAGKSTFLKLALGLLPPDQGDIFVNGKSIRTDRLDVLSQVGVLHENPSFPSWASVTDYLVWVGMVRGLTTEESQGQAEYLIQKFGLSKMRKKRVKNLSAGQRQRFGVCQAVIGLPRILFLDEPTANLDVQSRKLLLEFLKELSVRHGIQVVIMSHILDDLERYCDNVYILHKGQVVWQDSVNNLIRSGVHREYVLRGVKFELPAGVEVVRENEVERVIMVTDKELVKEIERILPQGCSMSPYRSLLEEKFVEMTGE